MIYNEQTVNLVNEMVKTIETKYNIIVERWTYNKIRMEFSIFLAKGYKLPNNIITTKNIFKTFPFSIMIYEHRYLLSNSEYDTTREFDKSLVESLPCPIWIFDELVSHVITENIKYAFANNIYEIKSIEPKIEIDYSKEYSKKYFKYEFNKDYKSAFIREFKINLKDSLTDYILLEDKGSIFEIKDHKDIFYKLCSKLRYPESRLKF